MPTPYTPFALINKAYKEAAARWATDIIVFVMDNSSPFGRLVSHNLPFVALGIDVVRQDELVAAAFPARLAIALLKRMDERYGRSDWLVFAIPPALGHFWMAGFGSAGRTEWQFSIPE